MYLVPNIFNHVSCRRWRSVVSPGRCTRGQLSMPAAVTAGPKILPLAHHAAPLNK